MMEPDNGNDVRRILVIDDNDAIHNDFRKTLAGEDHSSSKLSSAKAALFGSAPSPETKPTIRFEVKSALQGQEGLVKLKTALSSDKPFQVAFVDMRMPPGWDGIQTIEQLWAVDPNLQVVICTAYSDYSWEEISQKLGLTDRMLILKKPFDPVEVRQLAAALCEKWLLGRKAHIKMEEMERIIQERTADLAHAAMHDTLTALPNRALFIDRLSQALLRRKREPGYNFALFFIDFDGFKFINDSLGHETGDELLAAMALRLSQTLRLTDTICHSAQSMAARLGGDEFVVLADGIKQPRDVGAIAERLQQALCVPYDLKKNHVNSTASIGVTTADIGYERPEDVLRDADAAMYSAKAAGKACYVMFDEIMHKQVTARLELERELRQSVEKLEFVLHYQPIVSLASGGLEGFEALVRWQRPGAELVQPGDFIPCCEETGLIVPLGFWVLAEACRQLKQWQQQFPTFKDLRMSINLSARQLTTPLFADRVKHIIQTAGLDPQCISLEITETMMIKNTDSARGVLNELRQLGVRLELDDFGMGYSSLSFLHQLPINGIKIDRSFVQGTDQRRDYAAVIHAIITLARNLGLTLVAEGIETQEQLVMLQTMECDKAQGYLFSKPLPAPEAEAYIAKKSIKPAESVAA
jgi:diguanylate cyclase (GGDEF)-like protein